jgi:DNA processing protein
MDEKVCRLALTQIPKVGVVTAKQLVAHCGSALAVFKQSKRALQGIPGIGPQLAQAINSNKSLVLAEKELDRMDKKGIRMLYYLDPEYPKRLKHHADSPLILFYKGKVNLNALRVVSVVGTRKPTPLGRAICEQLIEGLRHPNLLVVSGLAYGIDSTAHKKSCELNIPNVAVLGHGLSSIYPAAHYPIARKIEACGGLISEYFSEVKPEKEHFPMRNRIIAGMCDALVVVETALKGGSVISAELANNYHKDVFAFPGRVNDPKSRGCNQLIKQHKAALIESAEDLINMMGWEANKQQHIQKRLFEDLSDQEKLIMDLFHTGDPLSVDYLSYQCHLPNSQLSAILLGLEFKGLLQSLPGSRFTVIR